jgi:Arc/MetJ-type ribon-helix-helix transcriptional regulator
MEAPVTLRLDVETRRRIARIAGRKRISKSEVIRQALSSWIEPQETANPGEALSDLLGVVRGGDAHRSKDSGRKFERLLKERAAGKRRSGQKGNGL